MVPFEGIKIHTTSYATIKNVRIFEWCRVYIRFTVNFYQESFE